MLFPTNAKSIVGVRPPGGFAVKSGGQASLSKLAVTPPRLSTEPIPVGQRQLWVEAGQIWDMPSQMPLAFVDLASLNTFVQTQSTWYAVSAASEGSKMPFSNADYVSIAGAGTLNALRMVFVSRALVTAYWRFLPPFALNKIGITVFTGPVIGAADMSGITAQSGGGAVSVAPMYVAIAANMADPATEYLFDQGDFLSTVKGVLGTH